MENMLQRNLELFRLVEQRQVNDEISEDLHELHERGVDVNFQGRNCETALHLAISKGDVLCVEFLMKCKPDLSIMNAQGETPEILARKVNHGEILALLKHFESDEFDAIDAKFIRDLKYENLSIGEVDKLSNDINVRILKIVDCDNVEDLLKKLQSESFKEAFTKTSHLFVIIVETCETLEINHLIPPAMFNDNRPVIFQVTSLIHKPTVYYKESKSFEFKKVQVSKNATKEQFDSRNGCCLSVLFQLMTVSDKFDGNVLDVKLKRGEIEQVMKSAAKYNVLCFRLLKLLKSESHESFDTELMFDVLQHGNEENLLAFLDLSFSRPKNEQIIMNLQRDNILEKVGRTQDVLIVAVQRNNVKALRLLLQCGIGSSSCDEIIEVIDIAWELKQFECLSELLDADHCFPRGFCLQNIPASDPSFTKISKIITNRTILHDAIKSGSIQEIINFIDSNPRLKCAYDLSNQSVLTVALKAKKFDIYSLLRAKGFSSGVDESFDSVMNSLSNIEKCKVRECNKEHFNSVENLHIMHLLSKSRLGFNVADNAACFDIIVSMFLELNQIPEIEPILRVLETCDLLQIIFDLNKAHVMDLDPMASENAAGMTYNKSGSIYVAAANHEQHFYEIIGTLIHELMHYAMQLIYENNCKPFEFRDINKMTKFDEIMKNLHHYWQHNPKDTDEIISNIFEFYPEDRWQAELIVRVPHMMACYKNNEDELSKIRETYCKDLFEFYLSVTIVDINTKRDLIRPQREVEKINRSIGLLDEIEEVDLRLLDSKVIECESFIAKVTESVKILCSNSPKVSLVMVCQMFRKTQGAATRKLTVFARFESISCENVFTRIEDAFKSPAKPYLIVYTDSFNDIAKHLQQLKSFENKERIILITQKSDLIDIKDELSNSCRMEVDHLWNDLDNKSKEKLMQGHLTFQGHSVKLQELLSPESAALQHLPLQDFITSKLVIDDITFNKSDTFMQAFYIERKFIARKYEDKKFKSQESKKLQNQSRSDHSQVMNIISVSMSQSELVKEADKNKIVIISDTAGMGKSTTLYHIAVDYKQKLHAHWISFIDLKQYIKKFEQISKSKEVANSFLEFFSHKLLTLGQAFDLELLASLYDAGKVVVFLDGFDEISPLYNNLMLNLVKSFNIKSGNQLWISTRAHLRNDLEQGLNQLSCCISPLTHDDKVEFLLEYWRSMKSQKMQINHASLADELIKKMSQISYSTGSDLMGIPIQVRMIAEIYGGDTQFDKQWNFYTIYETFIDKMIHNWMVNKGDLSIMDQKEIHKNSPGVVKVHQQIALKYFFPSQMQDDDDDEDELTSEMIARIGIINVDNSSGEMHFIHETFAEYFVADFISSSLKATKMNKRKKQLVSQVLLKVFVQEKYQMIRNFMDKALENQDKLPTICFESLKSCIQEEKGFDLLHNVTVEGLETLLGFSLMFVEDIDDIALRKQIINQQTKKEENILMLACSIRNSEISVADDHCKAKSLLEKTWKSLQRILSLDELKELIHDTDVHGTNALHFVVSFNNKNVVDTLCNIIKGLLSVDEQRALFKECDFGECNLFQHAAWNDKYSEILTTIWSYLNNVLTKDEIRAMLRHVNKCCKNNALRSLIMKNNQNALEELLEILKSVYTTEKLNSYLREKGGKFGRSVICLAAEKFNRASFEKLWAFASKVFDVKEQKSLITESDKNGLNFFHLAANYNNKDVVETLCNIIKNLLNVDEQNKLFLECSSENNNLLHHAAWNEKNSEIFSTLLICFQDVLPGEAQKDLFQQRNADGHNVMHALIIEENERALIGFLAILRQVFTGSELKRYLNAKESKFERNLTCLASVNANRETNTILWAFVTNNLERDELKALINETDKNGSNALQLAMNFNNKDVVDALCGIIKDLLSRSEKKSFYQKLGIKSNTILHRTAWNSQHEEIFITLWHSLRSVLSRCEIKIMLKHKNELRYNVLHSLIIRNNEKAFSEFLELLRELYTSSKLKFYLLEKGGKYDRSVTCLAAMRANESMFELFWTFMKSFFEPIEVNALITETDNNGSNALLLAVGFNTKGMIATVMNLVKELFTLVEQKLILQTVDIDDDNIFHYAATNKNYEIFDTLLDCLRHVFNDDVRIKHLLLQTNKNGSTPMHNVIHFNHSVAIKTFYNRLKDFLDIEEQRKLFMSCDHEMNNFFHLAAFNRDNEGVITTVNECLQNVLTENKIKTLLNQRNADGEIVFRISTTASFENSLKKSFSLVQQM